MYVVDTSKLRTSLYGVSATFLPIISLVCIVHSVCFTYAFFSSTPFWDIWSWIDDYKSYADGYYRWSDIFKVYNEHRIVTTRLLLFADALWFHMTGRGVVAANTVLLAAAGGMLGCVTSQPHASRITQITYILTGMAWMLSTVQWMTLIQPFNVQYTLLCLGVLTASVALARATSCDKGDKRLLSTWAVTASFFYGFAVFSMAGGLLALPSLILLMVLRRPMLWPVVAFLAPTILLTSAFLFGYDPAHAQPVTIPTSLPAALVLVNFMIMFLGNAFAACQRAAWISGLLGLLIYASTLAVMLSVRYVRRQTPSGRLLVPFAVGGALITMAASAAVARANGGLGGALEPRYATLSLLFFGCIGSILIQFLLHAFRNRGRVWFAYGFAVTLLLPNLATFNLLRNYRREAQNFSSAMKSQAVAIRRNVLIPPLYQRMAPWQPLDLQQRLSFLRQHRLSIFAPDAEQRPPRRLLAEAAQSSRGMPSCLGQIDYAYREDSRRFVVRGTLASPFNHRSAEWIALRMADGAILDALPATEIRKIRLLPGEAQGPHLGVWAGSANLRPGDGQELSFTPIGIFAEGAPSYCLYPTKVNIGPIRVQTPESLEDVHSLTNSVSFQPAGIFRVHGTTTASAFNAPFAGEALYASAAAGDAAKGAISFVVSPSQFEDVALPFATGPDTDGQSIEVIFHDGSRSDLAVPGDSMDLTWRVATLPAKIIAEHGGSPITFVARDEGSGWGQWLAVATPVSTKPSPDWAKLY